MSKQVDGHSCAVCALEEEHAVNISLRRRYTLGVVSAFSLALGILIEISGFNDVLMYLAYVIAALSAGRWIIPRGLRGVIKFHLDVNFLMTSASIGAFLIGAPAEGASVLFLFFIADLLERRTETIVKGEIQDLLELEPPSVTLLVQGSEVCANVEDVIEGDVMIVRPGHMIGLDGMVIDGESSVDQSSITGESVPETKSYGDEVFAGTMNLDGYLEVEVTKNSHETVLAKIIELVSETKKRKSPTEKFVSRFSHIYTPLVVFTALFVAVGFIVLGFTPTDAIYRGLALLVVSCPCAFAISIPVSMVSALGSSARDGVLVKGSEIIEYLSDTRIIAFDKTGTLTKGILSVENICLHESLNQSELISIAAQLESKSEHPIATAITRAATGINSEYKPATSFVSIAGKGVTGDIGGVSYSIGNSTLLDDLSITIPKDHVCGSGTLVYVLQDRSILGTISLNDEIRETSKITLSKLRGLGIETIMLTGDDKSAAEEVATSLGIRRYKSNLLPHEKVEAIRELSNQQTTVMVGDGINDAPSLAAADVGIAVGGIASDIAVETADVVLMNEDISKLPSLIDRAKRTMSVIKANVMFSISVKLVIAALAMIGMISLWLALILGDVGLTIAVVLNALRIAQVRKPKDMTSTQ